MDTEEEQLSSHSDSENKPVQTPPVKKGRGRPKKVPVGVRKVPVAVTNDNETSVTKVVETKKTVEEVIESNANGSPKRGRGRPRKYFDIEPTVKVKSSRPRGRPKKNRKSTPEKPIPEQPVAEQPVPEQPVPEKPVPEKPVPEKPVPEKPKGKRGRPKVQNIISEIETDESIDDPVISDVDAESEEPPAPPPVATTPAAAKKRGRPKKIEKIEKPEVDSAGPTGSGDGGSGDNIASDLEIIRASLNPNDRKKSKSAKRPTVKASGDPPRKRGRPAKVKKSKSPGRPKGTGNTTSKLVKDSVEDESCSADEVEVDSANLLPELASPTSMYDIGL